MFQAVSALASRGAFEVANPVAQAIVIASPERSIAELRLKWGDRVAFVTWDDPGITYDIVRELLFNPQIRAVVFDGNCSSRSSFQRIWDGEVPTTWKIDGDHLSLVRQFVDLYDDDFAHHGPPAPFWPVRIKYLE